MRIIAMRVFIVTPGPYCIVSALPCTASQHYIPCDVAKFPRNSLTRSNAAPEILAYEPISLAADIWSLGVLAYVLLTGFSPFGGETDQETLRNIASASLDFPAELFEGVSDEAKEFITECLHRNPK